MSNRPKKCKVCKASFVPQRMGQKVCGPGCAVQHARVQRLKVERRQHLKRKRELKTKSELMREAQQAFNAYVRERDRHRGCISCGIGHGQFHAGHYRTRAAAPQLAFNTFNVFKQCAQCNHSKSGNIVPFRLALVERIGGARLDAIERDSRQADYSREYLERLRKVFGRRARHLAKLRDKIEAQKKPI